MDVPAVLRELGCDAEKGLDDREVARRQSVYGPNLLEESRENSLWRMAWAQFSDIMIVVLLLAALVSGLLGELADTLTILVIVLLNAAIGFIQEARAQRALAALRKLSPAEAYVIRNGQPQFIRADELVPGDLVQMQAGNVVPADIRLVDTAGLLIDASTLTGESEPVEKHADPIDAVSLGVGDRANMVFKSMPITRGQATGVVVSTGRNTEIGQIAALLSKQRAVKTPLQQRLAVFSKQLAIAVICICAIIFAIGIAQGQIPVIMFLTATSLAVAAVPEALPAVATISLALGARRLGRKKALVRRLAAVETLGSVTFICSDKTGTLTQNRMSVESVYADGQLHEAIESANVDNALWAHLGAALALNNTVDDGTGELSGDPTELALHAAAENAEFHKQALLEKYPLITDIAFDSERKLMTTLHAAGDGALAYVKGAPEVLLEICTNVLGRNGLGKFEKQTVIEAAAKLAANGHRVLAIAYREFAEVPQQRSAQQLEQQLTFLGLIGLLDPPRAGAAEAVMACKSAGIVPVMITGDHPKTALNIAAQLGISDRNSPVVTGAELEAMDDAALQARARSTRVYARVDPAQKIRIVEALQEVGEFVAMTGDGVNDAPALKRAGIGVAMGERGTEVAREAADMVLLDDNFSTIVAAVEEGRRVFDGILKFIKYTLTSNAGEIWTLLLAPLLGLPIPLLPIHILWVNLLTDGLPGLAFTAEPAEKNIMNRPPRSPDESVFSHGLWQHILWVGLLIGLLSLAAQAWAHERAPAHWQTMVFTVLVFAQLFQALAVRSRMQSLASIGLLSNPHLLGAIAITVVLQLVVIYVPFFNTIFRTEPLPLSYLAICFGLGSCVLIAVEFEKLCRRNGWFTSASTARSA